MKKLSILFFVLVSFSLWSQTPKEQSVDSLLRKETGKTLAQYLAHFQQVDAQYQQALHAYKKAKKATPTPSMPSKTYTSEDFPMVVLAKGKKTYELKDISKVRFKKISETQFVKPEQSTALFGTQGQFGVYIVNVK